MSSAGQILGGIVGGVIGFIAGGPTGALYGAQIGIAAGGIIDPPDGPVINGPRLDDLSVQTSTYGAFIPRNYGTVAQTGNIFWLKGDKLTETPRVEESGGKGGPTTTTNLWDYSASFALGLCEGPITAVRKIWINGQLWHDAGSSELSTVMASNESSALFTLYLGTDTQLPDPLMQADKGIANVPSYRGIAYIVFDNLPLAKYNNSLAGTQIKVEIVKNGSTAYVVTSGTLGGGTSWRGAAKSPSVYCAVASNYSATSFDAKSWNIHPIELVDWSAIAWGPGVFCAVADGFSKRVAVSPDGQSWSYYDLDVVTERVCIAWNGSIFFTPGRGTDRGYYSISGITWVRVILPVSSLWSAVAWNGTVLCCIANSSFNVITSENGTIWTLGVLPTNDKWIAIAWNGKVFCAVAESPTATAFATSPDGVTWTTRNPPITDEWTSIHWNGTHFFVTASTATQAAISTDGIAWQLVTVPNFFWKSSFGEGFFGAIASTGETMTIVNPLTPSTEILGNIVNAECLSSNLLTASDLDVTELTDSVRGYRVSSLGALRGGIDPLRAAYPFDVVQNGYKIKFKRRGSASVVTINANELDARAAGENPGVQITNSREMDTLLPTSLRLNYIDSVREYDTNEQISDRGL